LAGHTYRLYRTDRMKWDGRDLVRRTAVRPDRERIIRYKSSRELPAIS
jgi:hypothetical protein